MDRAVRAQCHPGKQQPARGRRNQSPERNSAGGFAVMSSGGLRGRGGHESRRRWPMTGGVRLVGRAAPGREAGQLR
jgi:hypothetical protein